jgi:hypothetical protein
MIKYLMVFVFWNTHWVSSKMKAIIEKEVALMGPHILCFI